jgi:hypothetical protein
MPTFFPKSGAVAVAIKLRLLVATNKRYAVKLREAIDRALVAGKITSDQATLVINFLNELDQIFAVMLAVAEYVTTH